MFKYLFISMLLFCCFSCESDFNKDYFSELLKPTTQVKLYCFQNKDTSMVLINNPNSLSIFKEIINGNTEDLSSEKALGMITFYDHDKKIITATLTPSTCHYSYGTATYKTSLSYKAGMQFEEMCHKISD